MQIRFIIALVFSILVTIFALLNAQSIEVNFIFSTVRLSLALVILGSAAVGALIAALLSAFKQIKAMLKIRELEKQIKQHTDTIGQLEQAALTIQNSVPELDTAEDLPPKL